MARLPAVMFRRKVYVGEPRHKDAIDKAFARFTDQQALRVSWGIADGKETILFGTANKDGSGWEHDEEYQDARLNMYGFD